MKIKIIAIFFYCILHSQNPVYANKPHIIVIMADDMGHYDVGFQGSNHIPTPNLDALAYNGIILNRFYTQNSCTPSRTAFLTGNYPIRSGMQGYPLKAGENRALPHDMPTMPEQMKKLGYKTHLVGKWHLGAATRNNTPTGRGFDSHFGYWHGLIGYFNYLSFRREHNHTLTRGLDLHDNLKPVWSGQGKYATNLFTERALEIIDNHNVEVPLFLILSHLAPHAGKDGLELEVPNATLTNLKYSYINDPRRRRYADMVNLMDESTGRIVQKLNQKNMLENSIVLFFSDNGGQPVGLYQNSASNWPLRGTKFVDFEGGVRTAAAIFSPLFKKWGYVSTQFFHLTDWLPTFYSAAGGNLTDLGIIDGIDQWKVLTENLTSSRTEILINIDEVKNTSTIIGNNGRHKLIQGTFGHDYFDKYFGSSDHQTPGTPPYNHENVLESVTNQAITSVVDGTTTREKIDELRSQTDLSWCRDFNKTFDFKCTDGCLFDLIDDPCETTNILEKEVEIREELKRKLEKYRLVLVPQRNKDFDLSSDPIFYNNTWCTWLDDDWCFKTTNIERIY